MPRGRKNTSKCKRHEFLLKAVTEGCYFTHAITACFCDIQIRKELTKKDLNDSSICLQCPIFNTDHSFASPTFILASQKDQKYYKEHELKLKIEQEKKVQQYTDQKSLVLVPKPRSKNTYCSVCKQNYQDYLEHIQSSRHKKKIENTNYNKHIAELTDQFKKEHTQHQPQKKIKANHPTSIDDSDLVEIGGLGGRPRKKVKKDQPAQYTSVRQQPNASTLTSRYPPFIPDNTHRIGNGDTGLTYQSNMYLSQFGMHMPNMWNPYNFTQQGPIPPPPHILQPFRQFPMIPMSNPMPYGGYQQNPVIMPCQNDLQAPQMLPDFMGNWNMFQNDGGFPFNTQGYPYYQLPVASPRPGYIVIDD